MVAALGSLRDLVPPELQRRLAEAMRELLVAIRGLLDWYIEHLDSERTASGEVEDIPIS
jgi:predicted lipid carrier protein YhbT